MQQGSPFDVGSTYTSLMVMTASARIYRLSMAGAQPKVGADVEV